MARVHVASETRPTNEQSFPEILPMTTPTMIRKSARARKVTNYANDAYKELDSDYAPPPPGDASSSDEDFQLPKPADPAASGAGDNAIPESEVSELGTEDEVVFEDENEEENDEEDGQPKSRSKSQSKTTPAPFTPRARLQDDDDAERTPGSAPQVHRRHIRTIDSGKGTGRRKVRLMAQGASMNVIKAPDPTVRITYRPGFAKATGKLDRVVQVYGDHEEVLKKAFWVRDMWIGLPAVPEKAALAVSPFWEEQDKVEEDGEVGIGDAAQVVEALDFADTEGYVPREEAEPLKVVVGTVGDYEKVVFKRFGIYDLKKVGEDKKGFLLNAGAQVLSMDWATNRSEGTYSLPHLRTQCDSDQREGCQYLAISTLTEGEPIRERNEEQSPAFSRLPSKSTIQIWRFRVDPETCTPAKEPSIALMLCHDWGPARNIKWCPARLNFTDSKVLGYLAGVFADGIGRVLKVVLPQSDDDPTAADADGCDFLKFSAPAFECYLPDDIITTISWISSTSLAVGCASGSIAAWDTTAGTIPYLYTHLHQTYITGLSTCFPSLPTHIITSSMDGYSRLTSLIDFEADIVPNNRSRIAPSAITYVDALQAGVSVEEGAWVKLFPVRRYFSATTVAKQLGIVRSLAGSTMHTLVLSGGTEGEAVFSNPARRVFHSKIKNYQQTWFQLEYAEGEGGGTLRMTEGFRLEECEVKSKVKGGQQLLTTVYPLQICIGAVCWNQNLPFGGWAAAAASCGLVRVEDVALP